MAQGELAKAEVGHLQGDRPQRKGRTGMGEDRVTSVNGSLAVCLQTSVSLAMALRLKDTHTALRRMQGL